MSPRSAVSFPVPNEKESRATSLEIRDAETDRLVRELAERRQIEPDEAIKRAVRDELDRDAPRAGLWARIKPIRDRVAARPTTGLVADRAFYDSLNNA